MSIAGDGVKAMSAVLLALVSSQALCREYTIDSERTVVSFEGKSLGFMQRGAFFQAAGTANLQPEIEAGAARHRDRCAVSRSEQRAGRAVHPRPCDVGCAQLSADCLSRPGAHPVRVDGALTLRNVTRELSLHVASYACRRGEGARQDRCAMTATATFRRSAFGMSAYRLVTSDEISLEIRADMTAKHNERPEIPMQSRASQELDSGCEYVTAETNRLDEHWVPRLRFDLLANATDVHIDAPLSRARWPAMNEVQQLLA